MGLDMYLNRKNGDEVAYWRKANAIHAWFVENVQEGKDECQKSKVSTEQLKTLLKLCKKVLKDNDKAEVLLPPESGFFFGSTEIDQYYFEDIKYTKKVLKQAIEEAEKDKTVFFYQASW